MGILNKIFLSSGDSKCEGRIRLINNRHSAPAITYNRRTLFKEFNYRFRVLELNSVAS